ncbi:Peptidoglycan endopeptidase RipA precursor [Actinomadura rubteroloni]|uniref:Peptidoglycan endopeptidase RipA n=1 Tax=Actinomadura rubteroloni TaxID=1926885 RepID=A0A2P4UJ20_9ACTN|nr:NlpC/P60 family protein [Actinomadura rubteroloni]POM25053.1 Peptidoglycan endopeptidase RipA precursor [Actinomadura rubteroloni]
MLDRLKARRGPGDRGAATTVIVVGAALALIAGLLAFSRIAHADDLRTRAQTGADAAVLGALAPLRDAGVGMALQGIDPAGAGYWMVAGTADGYARTYAEKNDARLVGTVALSGAAGDTARADVRTADCQLKHENELTAKEKDDLRHHRNLCTETSGKQGIGRFGTARAYATLHTPECAYLPDPSPTGATGPVSGRLVCDGVQTFPHGDRARVERLFKIRLVDRADPVAYSGVPDGLGGAPGDQVVSECATSGKKPADELPFGERVVAWAMCWVGKVWYSWGGGTYSGPSRGIGTGANTVGFDCSGLTLYSVYQASHGKLALAHYTGNQVQDPRGRRITPSPSELRAGDLVFYGDLPTHHVAIYAGGGKMVEAQQTGTLVMVSNYRQAQYAMRFDG